MDDALVELLEKKDFEYITVKELCDQARVNRSTFYLHYESMVDLLEETLERTNKLFEESFDTSLKAMSSNIDNLPLTELVFINEKYLKPYLTFVKENKKVFMAAQRNPQCMNTDSRFASICENILIPVYKRFNIPEKEHEYWIGFYIRGMQSIINQWIQNECSETVEELMEIIIHCVRPYIPENKKR